MAKYVLTLIDVAGIQEYIFGSNDLAQNIGASERVALATRDWVFEALDEIRLQHNGKFGQDSIWELHNIDINLLDAEVIYSGGGNAALVFKNEEHSREFIFVLSRRLLRESPTLQFHCVHEEFTWSALAKSNEGIYTALERARRNAGEYCEPRPASVPLPGLGVTAACDFTTQPVYRQGDEGALVSRAVHAKLSIRDQAENRLWHAISNAQGITHADRFIRDFDEFGEADESSYIAVIHADGNGMGERIKNLEGDTSVDYIRNLRKFSQSVQVAAQAALQATVEILLATRKHKDGQDYFGLHDEIRTQPERLPFRPVVFGGDDVTFVSDGRLGLALTHTYLNALLTRAPVLSDGVPLYSRAGVAVVKNHYPFSRAYRLAEDLSREAKQALPSDGSAMALDWHFATSGALLNLENLRHREYTAHDGWNLLMRPIRLDSTATDDWRTWGVFRNFTHQFLWDEDNWQGRRNKVKALRDALRAGPEAVRQFLQNYQPPHLRAAQRGLPYIADYEALSKTGWDEMTRRCGYFDSIEATDFFVELEEGA